jgi:hypothetical protein
MSRAAPRVPHHQRLLSDGFQGLTQNRLKHFRFWKRKKNIEITGKQIGFRKQMMKFDI